MKKLIALTVIIIFVVFSIFFIRYKSFNENPSYISTGYNKDQIKKDHYIGTDAFQKAVQSGTFFKSGDIHDYGWKPSVSISDSGIFITNQFKINLDENEINKIIGQLDKFILVDDE